MKQYKRLLAQIFRFGVVGGLSTVLDFLLLLALTEWLHIHYLASAAVSYAISTVFNYWLSVHWVFTNKKERKKTAEFTVFVVLCVISLGINEGCMLLFTEAFGLDYRLSKIIATVFVMIWSFVTRKLYLEKRGTGRGLS